MLLKTIGDAVGFAGEAINHTVRASSGTHWAVFATGVFSRFMGVIDLHSNRELTDSQYGQAALVLSWAGFIFSGISTIINACAPDRELETHEKMISYFFYSIGAASNVGSMYCGYKNNKEKAEGLNNQINENEKEIETLTRDKNALKIDNARLTRLFEQEKSRVLQLQNQRSVPSEKTHTYPYHQTTGISYK